MVQNHVTRYTDHSHPSCLGSSDPTLELGAEKEGAT